ncbi:uncharacterized protein LOC141647759 [Silene latifolia]|uniref:uncharacterized protein LOC141647759 n=1 Tax=Silene latifolia TaxID=37657 RepID=UPI003D779898
MPRHRTILLMAMQNSLATTDNLCKRGYQLASRCTLCYQAQESKHHLFFACNYSTQVLQAIFTWQHIHRRPLSLNHEVRRLAMKSGKHWRKKLAKCALAVMVYYIWSERNTRIFQDICRSPYQLIYAIQNVIRIRLLALLDNVTSEEVISSLE